MYKRQEKNHSAALVRGTAARFAQLGYRVGGFDAYTTSDVLKGSGLSSSAAFEVLLGAILNQLYNGGAVSAVEVAKIAQYAENVYFGKPSGLMDQMASSVGGIITIDFADTDKPVIETVDFDFAAADHALCICLLYTSHLIRGDAGLGLLPVADSHGQAVRPGRGGSGFPRPQGLEHLLGDEGDQFFIEFHGFALLTESTRSQRPAGCF